MNSTIDYILNFHRNPWVVKNALIHFKIVLNFHTFILQYIFSGWGNEISPEKICTTFVSGIHPHLNSTKLYYHLVKWNISTRLIEKIQSSSPALRLSQQMAN